MDRFLLVSKTSNFNQSPDNIFITAKNTLSESYKKAITIFALKCPTSFRGFYTYISKYLPNPNFKWIFSSVNKERINTIFLEEVNVENLSFVGKEKLSTLRAQEMIAGFPKDGYIFFIYCSKEDQEYEMMITSMSDKKDFERISNFLTDPEM